MLPPLVRPRQRPAAYRQQPGFRFHRPGIRRQYSDVDEVPLTIGPVHHDTADRTAVQKNELKQRFYPTAT
jgi:hypothetical protein